MSAKPMVNTTGSDHRLGQLGSMVMMTGATVGVAGLAISVAVAAMSDHGWDRFFKSYLMAFMFVLSLCLGGLFFTILQHCVKAGWSVAIRRLAEGMAGNLMWIWLLFIPIFIGMRNGNLYEWTQMAAQPNAADKFRLYLNPTFWTVRAAVFLGIWALLARFFVRNSIAQDSTGDISLTRKMEKIAPLCVGIYFFSQAFASMDWVMSLSPHWFSTMFPVYFFAACCCGYFSVQILMMFMLQRKNLLQNEITTEHYQDAGKLLFAFGIVFWAYIGFSQFMLIWYANIPEETPWYLARQMGGWGTISLVLLFGHFAIPFVGLISRHPKRIKGMLAAGAAWMLLMHFVDVYWLVMPTVPEAVHEAATYKHLASEVAANMALGRDNPAFNHALDSGYGWHLLDLTCVLGLAGLLIAGTAWRLSGCALIPERDPRLHESLAFENI